MAKHKSIIHMPAAAPPPPAPRLAVQMLTVMGELMVVAACILGIVAGAGWMLDKGKVARPSAPPTTWACWVDRRYGEMCEPAARPFAPRRHFVHDFH
jgi:hypothetical protein